MKTIKNILLIFILSTISINAQVEADTTLNADKKYIETDVISLVNKDGFQFKNPTGEFLLNPYLLVLTRTQVMSFDDEGLNIAERDNIMNSGFGIPAALLGFAGKAFNIITFNFALNASSRSLAGILNQAWFDVNLQDEFRIRGGKFKTPMHRANLVRIGQNLLPMQPFSLTTRVNTPFDINAVNPMLKTGFDIGFQLHGNLNKIWEYQVGIFNGTGIHVNTATNSMSDDIGIPSLLYAGRFAYMPYGPMPLDEGDPDNLDRTKMLFAISSSFNVEANYESSNDLRTGFEFAYLLNRLYLTAEAYTLSMDFVERQRNSSTLTFWGSYIQAGYFVTNKIQPMVRFDLLDRNSTDVDGFLYTLSGGLNYFFVGQNLKLQCMYRYLGKSGYSSEFEENDDDNGLAEHCGVIQLQFAF